MFGATKRGLRRLKNWRGLDCARMRDRSGLRRDWASKLLNGINSRPKGRGRHQWLGHGSQVHANPRVHTAKPADTIGNSDYSFPSDSAFPYRKGRTHRNSKVSTFIGSRSREWSANQALERTAPRVTPAAPPRCRAHPHPPFGLPVGRLLAPLESPAQPSRRAGQSLSLGSLGVSRVSR